MNTIKIYLAESGRIADLKKDFPLYQGQYQNKLLNIYVPTSIIAPEFMSVNADGVVVNEYVASTSVKIGMSYTARDGKIKVSKNYYMRYLKTLTYQNVEYAMYERKLPKEFTLYAGQGSNAPILTANVVNIMQDTDSGTPKILSITASQNCYLDVMPSSDLDNDEAIEPSELENINARLNEIDENLLLKQNITDDALQTTSKTVVGAINENKGRIDTADTNITTNTEDIADLRNKIDVLEENVSYTEDYVGQLITQSLPTDQQLTDFVVAHTTPSRQPKNADVVIVIVEKDGQTDKNYKYFYTSTGWKGYEIPPMEEASNGSLGIVKGTYGVGLSNNLLVDISGGEILNVYIKDGTGTYRNLVEYLNSATQDIADIIDGTTIVGEAMKSLEDGLGNNIVNTYLTQTLGATKQYVRDYAMPKAFNDVLFVSADGYTTTIPTTPESGIQFTTTTDAIGSFNIFQLSRTNTAEFEITNKNGYSNNIFLSADIDCSVSFRMITQYSKANSGVWNDLNIELTNIVNFTAGDIQKVQFASPFAYIGDSVISFADGDMIRQTLEVVTQTSTPITFNLYSNSVYPSIFTLTSQAYTSNGGADNVADIVILGMDGVIESNRVVFTVQDVDDFIEYRTNRREFVVSAFLPVVGEVDSSYIVNIEFGDTVYNVYSFMSGSDTPLTWGDLQSTMTYNSDNGYSLVTKMIFMETSDYRGFVLSPRTITAQELANIIVDEDTSIMPIVEGAKLRLSLGATEQAKLDKALTTPMSAPASTELVGVDDGNSQTMIEIGDGLSLENNVLSASGSSNISSATYMKEVTFANYNELYNYIYGIIDANNLTMKKQIVKMVRKQSTTPIYEYGSSLSVYQESRDNVSVSVGSGPISSFESYYYDFSGINKSISSEKPIFIFFSNYGGEQLSSSAQFPMIRDNCLLLSENKIYINDDLITTNGDNYSYPKDFSIYVGSYYISNIDEFAQNTSLYVIETSEYTTESYTISNNSWTALTGEEPFLYKANVTAQYSIGDDTEVGIVNDNPVLFAQYGFVVASVSGQSVTIYATKQPTDDVVLSVEYRG